MRRVDTVIFLTGFVTVVAQTVIIREALSVFSGNELVSGILLATWLVWVGLGSIVYARFNPGRDPTTNYAILLSALCILLFASLCTIRLGPRLFGLPVGEIIDLGKIILISNLTLAPVCIVFGMLFPAACRILPAERVYFVESLGAFVGGIFTSLLLVAVLPPFGIIILSIMIIVMAILVVKRRLRFILLPLILAVVFARLDPIEIFFREIQMGTRDVIGLEESRYGMIAVTRTENQHNFYTNGLYDFSYPDKYSSEEAVHYVMLLHRSPEEVLLIGGGIGEGVEEILKHPSVREVTYVELDPLILRMGREYLGETLEGREKVNVVIGDARYYVKRSAVSYDAVIVNLPDPVNAQINRFYTEEFFKEVKRILNPDGVLSIRISTPPNIISPIYGEFLRTMHNTLSSAFSNVVVLPLAKATFIAGGGVRRAAGIVDTLSNRSDRRRLNLTYVNDYYFRYDLSNERIAYMNDRIAESKGYRNSDLKPVCYYFSSVLWGGILTSYVRNAFINLFDLPPVLFFLPLLLIFFFYRRRSMIYLSVLAVGASEISAEVILIVLFQVFYGYIYGWIGAIIACYMLGLAGGTLMYLKVPALKRTPLANLVRVELALSLYFALVIGVAILQPSFVNVIIAFLVLAGGFIGGMHFPLSVAVLDRQHAGVIYGIDLVGSSVGALVTATLLIPILGIIQTLLVFLLMNMLAGIGLVTIRMR
ncbi:MAG: hypothetical protein JSW49_03960 [candidate division WOR-3 bacterium]|nr:MAG: hypothetical protein JSW49_03960 [candidate division WOR-3 bacterium]